MCLQKRLKLVYVINKNLNRRTILLRSKLDNIRHVVSDALLRDLEHGQAMVAQIQQLQDEPTDASSDEDMRVDGGQTRRQQASSRT